MGCTCRYGLAIVTDMDVKQNGSIRACLYTGKHKLHNFPQHCVDQIAVGYLHMSSYMAGVHRCTVSWLGRKRRIYILHMKEEWDNSNL